jgi:hypothetical protein
MDDAGTSGGGGLLDDVMAITANEDNEADRDYVIVIAAASCLMAEQILASTERGDHAKKMQRVVDRKVSAVRLILGIPTDELLDLADIVPERAADWTQTQLGTLLIDLEFSDPFAPYSLRYPRRDFDNSLREVASIIGRTSAIPEIRAARRDAMRAHQKSSALKISMYGLGGAAVIAAGGWLAAPLIAGALGSAAGLTGAAATAHGLALLGGGSLAAGGMGMAGGMWMVAATGAAAGLAGAGGARAMFELGVAQTRTELVKLQVVYKVTLLTRQVEELKAQKVVGALQQRAHELDDVLSEERLLNDTNSRRVKDLAEKLEAVEETIRWMQSQGNESRAG